MAIWFVGVVLLDGVAMLLMALRSQARSLSDVDADPLYQAVMTYGGMGLLMLIVWVVYRLFDRKKGWKLGLAGQYPVRRFVQGTVMGLCMIVAACGLIWLLSGAPVIRLNNFEYAALWKGILLFIVVALNEELFIRGYVQGLVRHHFGIWSAVGISSLIFAIMHVFNQGMFTTPMPVINLLVAGVFFAICREWTGSLWLPVGLHFAWNYVQGHLIGFPVSGQRVVSVLQIQPSRVSWISGGEFGAEGSLITTVVMLCSTAYVMKIWHKQRFQAGESIHTDHSIVGTKAI
ncbi:CPBP family intramembrane metalloprotease [Paenibacillus sp. N1-5-1-14]|nr:CPBP family intramembrane metalloprotease [Paenibacillus radicibacter]